MKQVAASTVAVPYRVLINAKIIRESGASDYVEIDRHFMRFFLRNLLEKITVDEDWYLSKYPDVAEAISDGVISDAAAHYIRFGYFEDRMPYCIEVDEDWYLEQYSDVQSAIDQKLFPSAQAHFEIAGFSEGRLPYAGFALATLADR